MSNIDGVVVSLTTSDRWWAGHRLEATGSTHLCPLEELAPSPGATVDVQATTATAGGMHRVALEPR